MKVYLGLLGYIDPKHAQFDTGSDSDIEISYLPVRNSHGGKSRESSWSSRSKMICMLIQP